MLKLLFTKYANVFDVVLVSIFVSNISTGTWSTWSVLWMIPFSLFSVIMENRYEKQDKEG